MDALEFVKTYLSNPISIILIKDDPEAKKLLVAWTVYGHSASAFESKAGMSPRDALRHLWENSAPVDIENLARIAGMPVTRVHTQFERLKIANLVFPGSELPANVRAMLIGEVGYYVARLLPKGTKPNESPRTDAGGADVFVPSRERLSEGLPAERGADTARRKPVAANRKPAGRAGKKAGA